MGTRPSASETNEILKGGRASGVQKQQEPRSSTFSASFWDAFIAGCDILGLLPRSFTSVANGWNVTSKPSSAFRH